MISKDKVVFDTAAMDDTDSVGAYLRSSDGTLITHSTDSAKARLDISSGAEHYDGAAFAGGEKGSLSLAIDPDGNFAPLNVNSSGELLVDVQVTSGADKEEDSAHVSGDTGSYILSVRQDVLSSSTSANGDYQSFKTNALGAMWVQVSETAPASYNAWLATATSVADTAAVILASDLTNRRKIIVQNLSNKTIYLGEANTLTLGSGIRLSANASIEIELKAGVAIYAIANSAGGADIRIAQFAYN